MNKLSIIFVLAALFSHNIFAGNQSSIELHFNGPDGDLEVYQIPEPILSAEQNLMRLTSSAVEFACYQGDAREAMKRIDSLVADGGSFVTMYERFITENKLTINISYRTGYDLHMQNFVLEACK